MVRPSKVSRELRAIAAGVKAGRSRSEVLYALRRVVAAVGEVKVKLVKTEPSDAEDADETRFVQDWLITMADGSKIETQTDVGWGDEPVDIPHGSVELDVCGHNLTVSELLGMMISTGYGPVQDGEEHVLDAEWCSLVSKEGYLG